MSAANPITPDPPRISIRLTYPQGVGLVMIVLFLAIFGPCAFSVISQILEMSDGGVRKIRRNVEELKAGKTKTLHLISIRHTDALLEQIRGMPEIEDVYIEDADITVVGMRNLGTLPNLKTMMAYNGVAGDEGMLELRTCTKLESLALYDARITEDGIAELQRHIPKVRVSSKHDEDRPAHDPKAEGEIEVNSPRPTPEAPSEPN